MIQRFDGDERCVDPINIWQKMARFPDPKEIVDELCSAAGLPEIKSMPSSTEKTLVFRFIANFLTHSAFTRNMWVCRNGYLDTDARSKGGIRDYFDHFPLARKHLKSSKRHGFLKEPAYQFWFLCKGKHHRPKICLETSGRIWTDRGDSFDLMAHYKAERRIWPLLTMMVGHLLP